MAYLHVKKKKLVDFSGAQIWTLFITHVLLIIWVQITNQIRVNDDFFK